MTQATICSWPEPFQPLGIDRRVPKGQISGFRPGTDGTGIEEEERGSPVPGAKAGASRVDEAEPGGSVHLGPAGEEDGPDSQHGEAEGPCSVTRRHCAA